MRSWTPLPAAVAPIVLIGGWTLAAARQPAAYDSVHDTVSALAAHPASDPWIMTTGLAALGVCHLGTAAGLTEAGSVARAVLGVGGAATILVAASPQPAALHAPAATVAFVALAVWPALSRATPRVVGLVGSAVLLGLLGWFATTLRTGSSVGLSERVVAGAQALFPLGVVAMLIALRSRRAERHQ